MIFQKRHIFLALAAIAAIVFLVAAFGHIDRIRTETPALCNTVGLVLCIPNHKAEVDILNENRAVIMDIAIIVLGLNLAAFVVAKFTDLKRQFRKTSEKTSKA